jgi:hypothetical protein
MIASLVGSFSLTTLSGFVDLRNRTVCNAISWRVRRWLPARCIGRAPQVPTIYSPQMRTLLGTSFCGLCDALSQLFAERSVPCEHLTAEIPIKQLIFSIQIAKSGRKLIKFSASSSIQFNECRASRHCQNDRENHDKRCAVLRHVLSFRVRRG